MPVVNTAKKTFEPSKISNPVTIRTAELVTGRRLKFPLFDRQGVLLLAEGSVITQRFKDLLRQRELDELDVSESDASELTRPEVASLEDCVEDLDVLCSSHALAQQLEGIISSGSLFVKNSGPPASRNVVFHGCKGYDPQRREEMTARHQASAAALDGMMQFALQGRTNNANKIVQVAGSYLTAMSEDMDLVMMTAAEASQDASISQHCLQMSTLGMSIAVEMGLDAENVKLVGLCGLVHDWGMLKVPEGIRATSKRLSRSEFVAIQKHSIYSLEMLQNLSGIPSTVPLVCYQIHENPNGSGYPRRRNSRNIHLFAKILNVADAYTALTSPRPYRRALMPNAAMECLLSQTAEGLADTDCVQKLLLSISMYPIGSLVELSDKSIAQSIRRNGGRYSQPIVRIIRTANGEKTPKDDDSCIIDLSQSALKVVRAVPFPGRNEIELSASIADNCR